VITGWNKIIFETPYAWDGNSSIVVDISYTVDSLPSSAELMCDNTSFDAGNISSANDDILILTATISLMFHTRLLRRLDSAVTVTFWQFGNPEVSLKAVPFLRDRIHLVTG